MTATSNLTAPGSRSLSAPKPASPAAAPAFPRLSASWLAAQGRLPLAFMALGLAWLVIGAGMLALDPGVLALPHSAPAVVALTHAWVLGFFVTIATGASYQIAPVALGTTLASERFGWWHFGLHAVAVPGMVYSFLRWDMTLLGHFGSALVLGIIIFAFNTWRTIRRSAARDAVAWSLALAAGWLVLTVFAGLFVTANRIWPLWPTNPLALLRAHAHLGLAGFFLTLLQGVTFRLVPMFTLAEVPDWRAVRAGLWLSQIGLLGLVPALAFNHGYLAAFFGAVIAAGLGASAVALKRSLATRKKRRLDPGVRAFARGVVTLGVTALLGLVLVWPTSPWGSAPGAFGAMTYAMLLFAGSLLPIFTGMLCKIVPFLTWMRAYGPKVGRVPTPAAGALVSPRLESWAFALQAVALVPLAVGVWTLNTPTLAAGAWLLALSVGLFAADMIGVLKHLRVPAIVNKNPIPK